LYDYKVLSLGSADLLTAASRSAEPSGNLSEGIFSHPERYVLAPWKRIFDNNTLKNDTYFPILLLFQIKVVSLPSIKTAETK